MTHPLDLPVTEIARGIRAGRFSATGITGESLRRAHLVQETCNAFILIREDRALAAARAIDEAVAQGRTGGALLGVPFAAKDMTPTAGDLLTLGSWSTGERVADTTAPCIRRLEEAGAILIGKTTTPEFAFSGITTSPRWGVTRNPWDVTRTSGGSSGGAGVVVSAGVVPIAEGTDMGGSVRIPAAFCGTVGLKPSIGRIPMTILPSQFDSLSHFGPLARTVADALAFMEVTAGPDDADISSLPVPFDVDVARPVDLAGRRFAFSPDLGYVAVAPEVAEVMALTITRLREEGAVIEEVSLPWTRVLSDAWDDLWSVFMSGFFGDEAAFPRERMDSRVLSLIARGEAMSATQYKRIEILRSRMWDDLAPVLAQHDALLCPTCPITPPAAEGGSFGQTLPDGRYAGLEMTSIFNLVPQVPALSIPAGLAEGLPVGLQMIGRRFGDERLLALGAAIEAVLPPIGHPPGHAG